MRLLALLLFLFATCPPHALCPEHGVQGSWTSNKKLVDGKTYCQYEHPLSTGGMHKFWEKCD